MCRIFAEFTLYTLTAAKAPGVVPRPLYDRRHGAEGGRGAPSGVAAAAKADLSL
jgi:hypothetical protein